MSSTHTSSEHTPSEHSYSADPSGYITSHPRGNASAERERDPYEVDHEVNSASLTRSPPPALRGPRVRTTARKSVPLPRCVNLTNPPRYEGESSRPEERSEATRVVTGVPVAHPPGMTARESQWVLMMSQDIQLHEERMDQQHRTLNGVMEVLKSHSEVSDRTMEVIAFTRREVRALRMYLAWVMRALILVMGLLIWALMR